MWHEYTHGLSGRLVHLPGRDPGARTPQQSGSMGEAWSDWYASPTSPLTPGSSSTAPPQGDVDPFQYTDGNTILYRYEAHGLPARLVGRQLRGEPRAAGPRRVRLLRLRQDLQPDPRCTPTARSGVRRCGRCASQLGLGGELETDVTRGMELSPPDPSFLDMRNAILQADVVAFGGAHTDALLGDLRRARHGLFRGLALTAAGRQPRGRLLVCPVDCATAVVPPPYRGRSRTRATGDPLFSGVHGGRRRTQLADCRRSRLAVNRQQPATSRSPAVPFHTYANCSSWI